VFVEGAGGVEPDAGAVGERDLAYFAAGGAVVGEAGERHAGQRGVPPRGPAEQPGGEAEGEVAAAGEALVGRAVGVGGGARVGAGLERLEAAADAFDVLPGEAVFFRAVEPGAPAAAVGVAGFAGAQQREPFGGLLHRRVRGRRRRRG
jgi:hypothetical protein